MKKKLINFNFLTSLIFLGSNGGVLAMEDSGRESEAGKPAFSPAAPEETKARKAAYEKLKSEAMTLGLPTDGGIGVLQIQSYAVDFGRLCTLFHKGLIK